MPGSNLSPLYHMKQWQPSENISSNYRSGLPFSPGTACASKPLFCDFFSQSPLPVTIDFQKSGMNFYQGFPWISKDRYFIVTLSQQGTWFTVDS
jgi:hypothetical protein